MIRSEFFWQGDKLIAEHHANRHRSYLYEPDSFRPLALLEGFGPKETKPYHYQLDHLGTPQADKDGFYPFSANPQEENPARGYIVSANFQPYL